MHHLHTQETLLSATAFAAANGILPFGNTKDVKAAWNALQVTVPGARKSNEFYQELLDLGVVNSQVQLGDLRKLLEDVDFGGTLNKLNSDWGLKRLLNRLKKLKKVPKITTQQKMTFGKYLHILEKNLN